MAPRRSAASSTLLAIGPTWSRDHEIATMPWRLTRPYVGFSPTTPQTDAGRRTEPEVSPPVQSSSIAAHRDVVLRVSGLLQALLGIEECDEGADARFDPADPSQHGLHDVHRAHRPGGDLRGCICNRQARELLVAVTPDHG